MFKYILNGFGIIITRSNVTLKQNEVSITFLHMYYSDWLVSHGNQWLVSLPKPTNGIENFDVDSFNTIHLCVVGNQVVVLAASSRTQL